jgi:hypothetical protein
MALAGEVALVRAQHDRHAADVDTLVGDGGVVAPVHYVYKDGCGVGQVPKTTFVRCDEWRMRLGVCTAWRADLSIYVRESDDDSKKKKKKERFAYKNIRVAKVKFGVNVGSHKSIRVDLKL